MKFSDSSIGYKYKYFYGRTKISWSIKMEIILREEKISIVFATELWNKIEVSEAII
jgi:hypothetical protein